MAQTDRVRDDGTRPGPTGRARARGGQTGGGTEAGSLGPCSFWATQASSGNRLDLLPPRKSPLDLLGARTGWAAKAGSGPSPGRLGPRRESVAAKSHPKLLAAQTCSWGGARSLGGSGVGVGGRLPPVQFRKPETGGSWLRVPQNRSQGKGIPGRGNSLCKGLWVSERAGQEVLGHHGSEA